MKRSFQKSEDFSCNILFFLLLVVILQSCKKDYHNDPVTQRLPDLTTKVTTSVSGFVTNENNAPVTGALVKAGAVVATTDQYGFFEIKNVELIKDAAIVSVSYEGYFKSIKTCLATEGKASFFRIKLIPKTNEGTIEGSSGGIVSLSNAANINFPANAIKNPATGAAYTGTVNVDAHYLDPTSEETDEIPGDLRGINAEGYIKKLTSYGMMVVELTGASGELLQIADGKLATLTIPIPASILSNAPSSIPLWYFDETSGLWRQEGIATKTGSAYTGQVAHFSYWSTNYSGPYVQFDLTLHYFNGSPLANTYIFIHNQANPSMFYGWGFTDATGYIMGSIPPNAALQLDVYAGYYCGSFAYSQNLNTNASDISLGTITISDTTTLLANITGTITNCNNTPITNGRIIIQQNSPLINPGYNVINLSNTGSFNITTAICNNPTTGYLIGEDFSSGQQSEPAYYTLSPGVNNLGNIQACSQSNNEFINYDIDGTAYSFNNNTGFISLGQDIQPSTSVLGGYFNGPASQKFVTLKFDNSSMTLNSLQNLKYFRSSELDSTRFPNPIPVNITEYGIIGQFVSGNFTGTITNLVPSPADHTVTGSFRVRRNF